MYIEIVANDDDGKPYLHEISEALNKRFRGKEDMEQRLEIYCDEIAVELGGIVGFADSGRIVFNFTGLDIKDELYERLGK